MIHFSLSNHKLAYSPISSRYASRGNNNPPQGLPGTTECGTIDRRAHEDVADAVCDGNCVHSLLCVSRAFLRSTLGGNLRVWKLEEGEGHLWFDEPQDAEANEDGGVEACCELEIWERGEHHCIDVAIT